ncbi:DUF7619 domain-containing protein [Flavobacterium sp. XGLA_31]|uniref:DUF7619 domain-containing protein n=1 Tax=Flavobacterium sp. XGLA_31 TaxID=3447666 RepID=UPI003F415DFC
MKKSYSLLFLIFSVLTASAQIIDFPDPNFKAWLMASSPTESIAWNMSGKAKIDTNNDGEIEVSEALEIIRLNVSNSNVSDLTGLGYFTNLIDFRADHTNITAFNFPEINYLLSLSLNYNNNLTALTLSNPALRYVYIDNNQISSLTLQGPLPYLELLYCNSNNLTSIDLSACPALVTCFLMDNQLTSIVFPNYPSPTTPAEPSFDLSGNQFVTLTAPNHLLGHFISKNNPNLTYLNLKEFIHYSFQASGFNFHQDCDFSNCPVLEYVCARESDLSLVQSAINYYGYTNCHVNTYCSFNPGGTFYTLQGTNTFDSNNNGCDSSDGLIPNMKYSIFNGSSTTTLVAGNDGSYHYNVQDGTYTITPVFENPLLYTANPTSATVTFPATSSPSVQDFCVVANDIHNDLEVSLFPTNAARPGFDSEYKIIYKNPGTTVQSGTISLTYNDSLVDFVSANPNSSSQSTNTLSWSFVDLLPFETREITVVMNVNSPMETPAVNGDDILNYVASVTGATDETPNNNSATLNQTVMNSFDPNDKTCIEGTTISPSIVGDYVHYMIRFENTGTANAENIVVKDVIDTTKFVLSSLTPLSGSANFVTRITSNKVEFIFENIQLPFDDANNDGYVAFKIKTKSTLVPGDTFSNAATIYFDYNFPITTNTYTTTVYEPLGNPDFDFGSAFTLSPVPAKNELTIRSKQSLTIRSVSIYNMLGQLMEVHTNPSETLDVSNLKTGSYLIKVISDKGTSSAKFIKE